MLLDVLEFVWHVLVLGIGVVCCLICCFFCCFKCVFCFDFGVCCSCFYFEYILVYFEWLVLGYVLWILCEWIVVAWLYVLVCDVLLLFMLLWIKNVLWFGFCGLYGFCLFRMFACYLAWFGDVGELCLCYCVVLFIAYFICFLVWYLCWFLVVCCTCFCVFVNLLFCWVF